MKIPPTAFLLALPITTLAETPAALQREEHRILIVLPAILAFPLAGCVVGSATGQTYADSQRHTYANFDKIDLSAGVEAVVRQGAFDVTAETTKGEGFDNLIVEVSGDTLRISRKPSMLDWGGPQYRVTVSAPAYSALEASSGSRMEGTGLTLKDLSVEVSSGASMELEGACNALEIAIQRRKLVIQLAGLARDFLGVLVLLLNAPQASDCFKHQ